jgi:predicted amidohydrolase
MIDHYTGAKQNGTVCVDNFDGLSAHVICHSRGYASAMFERYGAKMTNFAELVYVNQMHATFVQNCLVRHVEVLFKLYCKISQPISLVYGGL